MKVLLINKETNIISSIYDNCNPVTESGYYTIEFDGEIPIPSIGNNLVYIPSRCTIESVPINTYEFRLKKLNLEYEARISELTSNITYSEIKTWDRQVIEATNYLTNNDSFTPLLDSLCKSRGCTKDYLADKILTKSNEYLTQVGLLLGELKTSQELLKL